MPLTRKNPKKRKSGYGAEYPKQLLDDKSFNKKLDEYDLSWDDKVKILKSAREVYINRNNLSRYSLIETLASINGIRIPKINKKGSGSTIARRKEDIEKAMSIEEFQHKTDFMTNEERELMLEPIILVGFGGENLEIKKKLKSRRRKKKKTKKTKRKKKKKT